MSLADEVLADLQSDEDDNLQDNFLDNDGDISIGDENQPQGNNRNYQNGSENPQIEELLASGSEVSAQDLAKQINLKSVEDVQSVSNLMNRLIPIIARIEQYSRINRTMIYGNIEEDEEYQFLVDANGYSVEIDTEIVVVHKFIKDHYETRFPELQSLVLNPVEYAQVVKAIGNDVENLARKDLQNLLTGGTFMIITLSAHDSNGKPLTESQLISVLRACDLLLALDDAKKRITDYVSSRLSIFAPNISIIVGPHTAAQLMGFAGGLKGLAYIPNANIPALGSKRQISIGFGQVGTRQQGFLYHSEVIQAVPPEYRTKAMRIVSGKLGLAARVDLVHSSTDGSQGRIYRDQINERIEKLVEPPENKGTKALPIPEDKPSKKRGGKRIRKFKEQFKQTELQKAQNRMAFGEREEEVGVYDESVGLGMAGLNSGNNSIRSLDIDNKTRARMSKGMQARLNGLASVAPASRKTEVSGLVSSLAFTPAQAIELVDPSQLARLKQTQDSDRWFKSGTFSMINPGTNNGSGLQLGPGNNHNGNGMLAPTIKRPAPEDQDRGTKKHRET